MEKDPDCFCIQLAENHWIRSCCPKHKGLPESDLPEEKPKRITPDDEDWSEST